VPLVFPVSAKESSKHACQCLVLGLCCQSFASAAKLCRWRLPRGWAWT
jgi:hypothetical protein